MDTFADFLARKATTCASALPLVHTTRALHLKKFMSSNQIFPSWCDVFQEKLNYFFVGRPAYKHRSGSGEAAYWELPACFILEFEAISDFSRIYPFDTGAFKAGLMPPYVQIMDRDFFEVGKIPDAPQKIMGAFFGSPTDYFKFIPKDKTQFEAEFSLGAFDEEIRALHMLASRSIVPGADDRRLCIEIQSNACVTLTGNKLLAVICPSIYFDDSTFRRHVEMVWRAEPISYNWYPLSYGHYISQIYDKTLQFYLDRKILTN